MGQQTFIIIMNLLVGVIFWELGCYVRQIYIAHRDRKIVISEPAKPDDFLLNAQAQVDAMLPYTTPIAKKQIDKDSDVDLKEIEKTYDDLLTEMASERSAFSRLRARQFQLMKKVVRKRLFWDS